MANWESINVSDAISWISENKLVLPVIQRRLVWDEDKMELLFDTLLKGNSFGGIMTMQEEKDFKPLFAYRYFTKDGSQIASVNEEKISQNHYLVIDGQQRLQSFYIGLIGSINGKILYFDLFSDHKRQEYDFEFTNDSTKLKSKNNERETGAIINTKWYKIASLYQRLKETNDEYQVADEIIKHLGITEENEKEHILRNVRDFYRNVFGAKHVGISKVTVNKSLDELQNRQKIVELFRRLNDGGTRLSGFDLVASLLKGFEWRMEQFLDQILKKYQDIGLTQDTLIKLIFLLRDNYSREMVNIEAADADFAVKNKDRIEASLNALKKFLINSKLYDYYRGGNRSFIPLYFIAYHIFHSKADTNVLPQYFDTFDTNNKDFREIFQWIYQSLLSGVFKSRGAGWIPYKTGVRKLLLCLKNYKGKKFPKEELFKVYKYHPVDFYEKITSSNINYLDNSFLFFILYDREEVTRLQDTDHIHAYSLLSKAGYDDYTINKVENLQLLDSGTNRGLKSAKTLKEWIDSDIENKELYLSRHLIPNDETLWEPEKYLQFLDKRRELMIKKIDETINV